MNVPAAQWQHTLSINIIHWGWTPSKSRCIGGGIHMIGVGRVFSRQTRGQACVEREHTVAAYTQA